MSSFYGGGGSSFDPATLQTIKTYICGIGEYSVLTGLPTISNPDQNTFYLVPGENGYNEYYYKNGNWELFGSADIVLKNLKDASAIGSVKSVGATEEDINYTMGNYAFAQGRETKASGVNSHAQGNETISSGVASHSEGNVTIASGDMAHAEGYNTIASGDMSHVEGVNTIANHISQHVFGAFNIADPSDAPSTTRGNYIEIVGNGVDVFGSGELRSNARTLDWSGNEVLAGKLTVGSGPTNNMDVATKQYVDQNSSSFDLSDRIGKGVDDNDNVVDGAVVEGITNYFEDYTYYDQNLEQYVILKSVKASGIGSHAEGASTFASGIASHTEGRDVIATGDFAHAEGSGGTSINRLTLTGVKNSTTYIAASGELDSNEYKVGRMIRSSNDIYQIVNIDLTNNSIQFDKTLSSAFDFTNRSFSFYFLNTASGDGSHTEGFSTTASGAASHAEGANTVAFGYSSHTEGSSTTASGDGSHAEGGNTIASGDNSHAEGLETTASGDYSHAEGLEITASGEASHAEGQNTTASGYCSHAEGGGTTASGYCSHAEGVNTIANHASQHVFGEYNIEDPSNAESYGRGNYVEIVGKGTANNARSNARTLDWNGNEVLAGKLTVGADPTNNMDVATKQYVDQHGGSSFDLSDRIVKGVNNQGNTVKGAVIEGLIETYTLDGSPMPPNKASGEYSHAEGHTTTASGIASHAEGWGSIASGYVAHAENGSTASGNSSHAEGQGTIASGNFSHAEGHQTIANHASQHVFGEYNIADPSNISASGRGNYVEIVGNGDYNARSNARTLDWNGNEKLSGSLTLGANTVDETVINPHTIKSISESITTVEFANSDWNVGSANFSQGVLTPADTGTRAWMIDLLDPNTQSINFDSDSYRILFFIYNKSGVFQQRTEWLTAMPTFDFNTYDYRLIVRKQPDSGNITATEAIAGVEIIVKSYNGEVSDITTSLLKSRKIGTSIEIADAAGGKVLSCVGSNAVTVSGYNLCKYRNIYGVGSVDCQLGITLPAGTYTLTARCTTTNSNVEQVKVFLGSFQGVMSVSGERVSRTYTLTRDIDATIGLYADNQTSTLTDYEVTLSDIVLSEGVNPKPYEPYFDPVTYTANELSNVKLTEYTNIVTSSSEFTISYINKNNVFAKSLASSLKINGNNFVQPEDFGAAGDGYQDDAAAINSCISYAIANGLVIRGYNSYRTSSPIQIIGDNVDLFINKINYVGSGNAVVYQGTNSMIQIDYIQSKGTGFRVQAATANVYYNTFTFNDIDAALDGFVVYASYNAYQNKLNFSRIRGGTSYSCILFERDPNTATGYLSEWQINGGLLTRSLWGIKGELNVAILLNVQTENLGSENNGGAIYSTNGAMPSIIYARTGEIILHNTLLKMSGTFKKTINPITNPTGVTLQAIDITGLVPDTASEMKSDNARIVTNFMVQKEAMSSVRLTDHLVIWGNRFQFPQTVVRSLNVTEDLDMRNQYYNDIIPQRFVSDNVTATIRLHPTYAANCLQSFIVEQKNGGELDIYDYVGNLIFDGSQQGNGKFKVSVYLNGNTALQYDMGNQIWDIEEIAIPVGGVSF